jgi:hypothetical protein
MRLTIRAPDGKVATFISPHGTIQAAVLESFMDQSGAIEASSLSPDVAEVIRNMAKSLGISENEAIDAALRDWAIGHGMLPPEE